MRRRDLILKGGAPSSDLLVCFPHRAHLTVIPTKPTCSPARHMELPRPVSTAQPQPVARPRHRRSKSSTNGKVPQASPVLWVKTKHMAAAVTSEPTSPKVTCVGQIKVQAKNGGGGADPCKGWRSVMHEIERIHKDKKRKKRSTWGEALGFNKDVVQFLTCLRSLKFNFRCFGNFPEAVITSDDEEDDDDEEEYDVFAEADIGDQKNVGGKGDGDTKAFSKWYMVLQEEEYNSNNKGEAPVPAVPPPNALLLMRCRSAPAKSWLVDTADFQQDDNAGKKLSTTRKNLKILIEEEKKVEEEKEEVRKKEEGSVTASYDTDYYRISVDVAQEMWIVGGFRDMLTKSRSWKI